MNMTQRLCLKAFSACNPSLPSYTLLTIHLWAAPYFRWNSYVLAQFLIIPQILLIPLPNAHCLPGAKMLCASLLQTPKEWLDFPFCISFLPGCSSQEFLGIPPTNPRPRPLILHAPPFLGATTTLLAFPPPPPGAAKLSSENVAAARHALPCLSHHILHLPGS